ncbi:hypothetical protein JVU11DRAFT_10881 [Chiua virens]|nr:hypothetical protein JVU11DRAFT_10881 [Chiua virens]
MTWDILGRAARNSIEVPIFKNDGTKEMVPIPSWTWAAWSAEELVHLNEFPDFEKDSVRPVIQFHIVDRNQKLVKIEDREGNPDHHVHAAWEDPTSRSSFTPTSGPLKEWFGGARRVDYIFCLKSDYVADPNVNVIGYDEDIRQQDLVRRSSSCWPLNGETAWHTELGGCRFRKRNGLG